MGISFADVRARIEGKTIAIVGSGPSCLLNDPGFVDSHDIVVRVNNYKTGERQGKRCDIFYSFFGTSIHKSSADLKADGVTLCICKLPNSKPLQSEWHERTRNRLGIDYRYIYRTRADWWFCDVFIPSDERFLKKFELLGKHQPTTGFAAILDILECEPARCYLTGFDFFQSHIHNVDEPWRQKNTDDPIGHRPERELDWIVANMERYPLSFDSDLAQRVKERKLRAA